MICVNKQNYTASVINQTKKCNISVLTKHTPFSIFKRFGFQSGATIDKFQDFEDIKLSKNGVCYLTKYSNAFISLNVVETLDLGTHFGFICTIGESKTLNNDTSLTYEYYMNNIKPIPPKTNKKVGWICKICGYVYEGEVLPKDFICPICKHGVDDFEKLK